MEIKQNYMKYIKYLLYSLLLTTFGAYLGGFIPATFILCYAIASLILILAFFFTKGKTKKVLFYIFSFGEGVCLAPILYQYTSTSLFICFGISTVVIGLFALIGYKTKDLGFLKQFLFISLCLLLVYTIASMFFPLPSIAFIGIVIFCLYLAYDINKFKNKATTLNDDEILEEVMEVYLDIINIIIFILKLYREITK